MLNWFYTKQQVEFPSPETIPGDAQITSNVGNMLLWNDNIDATNIMVNNAR